MGGGILLSSRRRFKLLRCVRCWVGGGACSCNFHSILSHCREAAESASSAGFHACWLRERQLACGRTRTPLAQIKPDLSRRGHGRKINRLFGGYPWSG